MNDSPLTTSSRIYWVDNARGFVMLGTILGWLIPQNFSSHYRWFFHHSNDPQMMSLPDVGLLAYVMIMGMMIRLSFAKRRHQNTVIASVLPLLKRFTLLMIIATFLEGAPTWFVTTDPHFKSGTVEYSWSALYTLGICGILGTLCAGIPSILAALLAVAIRVAFDSVEPLQDLIGLSRFAGPFGALFGFFPALLISFALADLTILKKPLSPTKTLALILSIGFVFLGITAAVFNPNSSTTSFEMRRVTLPFLLTGSAIVMAGIGIFSSVPLLKEKPTFLLSSLGKNSLLIFLWLLCEQYLYESVGASNNLIWCFGNIAFIFLSAILLDKHSLRLRL